MRKLILKMHISTEPRSGPTTCKGFRVLLRWVE
jgi:hypothetical protein